MFFYSAKESIKSDPLNLHEILLVHSNELLIELLNLLLHTDAIYLNVDAEPNEVLFFAECSSFLVFYLFIIS